MAHSWTIKGGRVLGPAPFFIAGIVNVTPDSFFDGGRHEETDSAVAHGIELASQGAQILDIGGESTRPGAAKVDVAQELARVVPVVSALAERLGQGDDAPVLAVDTYKAEVARAALLAGASIVNDVSACRFDPALAEVVAEHKPGYVLMHTADRPERMQAAAEYEDVVEEIMQFFSQRLGFLASQGVDTNRVVLDPGIGFGKTLEHNISILQDIDRFSEFGLPLYVGLSNKSLWGALLDLGIEERTSATVAATALTYAKGVAVHRVHDVAAAYQALTVAARIV